ncbi:MAG: hypothetical protein H7X80_10000, partial [bacterium]|nr:hypothetical protein [Candidatus Kapabacteria bacterium]
PPGQGSAPSSNQPSGNQFESGTTSSGPTSSTPPVSSTPEQSIIDSTNSRFGEQLSDDDAAALALAAFIETVKAQREQIEILQRQIAAAQAAVEKLQAALADLQAEVAKLASAKDSEPCATIVCSRLNARIDTVIVYRSKVARARKSSFGRVSTVGDMRAIHASMKGDIASMSDLGETESLRIARSIAAHNRMLQTLRTLMRSVDNTSPDNLAALLDRFKTLK